MKTQKKFILKLFSILFSLILLSSCVSYILLSSCVSYHAQYSPETGLLDIRGSRLGDQQISFTLEKTEEKVVIKVEQMSQATALNEAIKTINRLATK